MASFIAWKVAKIELNIKKSRSEVVKLYEISENADFIWNSLRFPMMSKRAFATLLLFWCVAKGCSGYSNKRSMSAVLTEKKLQKRYKKPFATIATFAPKGFS